MQTRLTSALEALVNVAVGFCVSLLLQVVLMDVYRIETSFTTDFQITIIFTIASLARSYFIRRFFNFHGKNES